MADIYASCGHLIPPDSTRYPFGRQVMLQVGTREGAAMVTASYCEKCWQGLRRDPSYLGLATLANIEKAQRKVFGE